MSQTALAEAFNAKFGVTLRKTQIVACLINHSIQSGRTGCFEKGDKAWNLGKRGYMGPNRTSFQLGHMPSNKRRLWSERISKDGYVEISVPERNPHTGAPTRYRLKHIWLWEMEHGPVPKGHALTFKDGNRLNCAVKNLMMVSRAELLCLNLQGYNDMRNELKPSVLALAKLEAKAGIRTRPGRGLKKKGV